MLETDPNNNSHFIVLFVQQIPKLTKTYTNSCHEILYKILPMSNESVDTDSSPTYPTKSEVMLIAREICKQTRHL